MNLLGDGSDKPHPQTANAGACLLMQAVISPLLANVYLHYVLDLWVHQWRTRTACGDVTIVRYADDYAMGFQHRAEAERFLKELEERLAKFGLALHPDKTRLIEFGRFAAENRKRRSQNMASVMAFRTQSIRHWLFALRRRSHKHRLP